MTLFEKSNKIRPSTRAVVQTCPRNPKASTPYASEVGNDSINGKIGEG